MNDLFLDSNIFLRHFLQDIPSQSPKATAIISEIEKGEKVGHVSILVVNEVLWILKRFYHVQRKDYISQIVKILHINNMKVVEIKKEILLKILEKMKKREIDFIDVYLSEIAGSKTIVSFDKNFQKMN